MSTTIPRYEKSNQYNYSDTALAKRTKALKEIQRDFPKVNATWAEWLYDVVEHLPDDEVKEIINKGLWEAPSTKYSSPQEDKI